MVMFIIVQGSTVVNVKNVVLDLGLDHGKDFYSGKIIVNNIVHCILGAGAAVWLEMVNESLF